MLVSASPDDRVRSYSVFNFKYRNIWRRIQYETPSCEPGRDSPNHEADRIRFMKATLSYLLAQMLANAIIFTGVVAAAFPLTGRWPPRSLLVAASIGGSLSPLFWLVQGPCIALLAVCDLVYRSSDSRIFSHKAARVYGFFKKSHPSKRWPWKDNESSE